MKYIPKIYFASFLLILLVIFFSAAYAIAATAVDKVEASGPADAAAQQDSNTDAPHLSFTQRAAIWVCPLH